jgi:hypothetical protein
VVLFWVAIVKTDVAFPGVADRGYPNIGWFNIWLRLISKNVVRVCNDEGIWPSSLA